MVRVPTTLKIPASDIRVWNVGSFWGIVCVDVLEIVIINIIIIDDAHTV